MEPFKKVRHQYIHLADNEWGTPTMQRVATNFINASWKPGDVPLVVTVIEHGGWQLGFAMVAGEVKIISSANDSALYPQDVKDFKQAIYYAEWEQQRPEIRRNDGREHFGNLKEGDKFDYDGNIMVKEGHRAALQSNGVSIEMGDSVGVLPLCE